VAGLELALVDVHSQGHHRRTDVEVVGEGQYGEVKVACPQGELIENKGDTADRKTDRQAESHQRDKQADRHRQIITTKTRKTYLRISSGRYRLSVERVSSL